MRKRHRERQLDLLVPTNPETTHALPEDVQVEVRDALRMLLIEVVIAERGEERCDEQDHD